MQAARGGAGIDAELLGERRPQLLERLQRLGLAAGAVSGRHQECGEPLAQGERVDQCRQFGGHLVVAAQRQAQLGGELERAQPQLLQVADGDGQVEPDARQRFTAPEAQCLLDPRESRRSVPLGRFEERGEPRDVDGLRRHGQPVAAGVRHDRVRAQNLAEPGDADRHGVARVAGPAGPDLVEQRVGADRPFSCQGEDGQHRRGPAPRYVDRRAADADLERAQQADGDSGFVHETHVTHGRDTGQAAVRTRS